MPVSLGNVDLPSWWKPKRASLRAFEQYGIRCTYDLLKSYAEAQTNPEVVVEDDGTIGTSLQNVLDFCNDKLGSLHLTVRDARTEEGVLVSGRKPHTFISAKPKVKAVCPREPKPIDDGTSIGEFFECPISQEIFNDPVVAADGHTYERKAIEAWFTSHATSPMTNEPLLHLMLVPNILVRGMIKQYKYK